MSQDILRHSKHDPPRLIHDSSHPPGNSSLKQGSTNSVPPFAAGLADGGEGSDAGNVDRQLGAAGEERDHGDGQPLVAVRHSDRPRDGEAVSDRRIW